MSDTSRPPLQLALQRTPRDETTRLSLHEHYTLCLALFVKGVRRRHLCQTQGRVKSGELGSPGGRGH